MDEDGDELWMPPQEGPIGLGGQVVQALVAVESLVGPGGPGGPKDKREESVKID